MAGLGISSSSSSNFDVFLSSHGEDARQGLYEGLSDAGIHVFRADEEISTGIETCPELVKAIEQSKIVIPILSRHYPTSRYLMDLLVKICELRRTTMAQSIIPVFYYVHPSDVRHCSGYLEECFRGHEMDGIGRDVIDAWKRTLREIGELEGLWISNAARDGETLILKAIISNVVRQLRAASLVIPSNLVGVDHHVRNILTMLDVVYDRQPPLEVRVVGICGMPGTGKTTLARIIYNHIGPLYCSSTFIPNIGGRPLASSLEQLIFDLQRPEYTHPLNFEEGCEILKRKFRKKRVLIVLDNVESSKQIKTLVANLHWFGPGSRIIMTTRARDTLDYYHKQAEAQIYEIEPLKHNKALELFHKHTFGDGSSLLPEDYESLFESIYSTVGGFPLTLEILGSYLKRKERGTWETILHILEREKKTEVGASGESNHLLREIVKEILDTCASDQHLRANIKEMFLDIACFPFEADVRFPVHMWRSCGCDTDEGMQELQRLCFVKITEKNRLWMHEQLRDIGRQMAEQERTKEGRKRLRLWNHQDAPILEERKGTAEVEAPCFTLDKNSDICFTSEAFHELSNLRYLKVNHIEMNGNIEKHLSNLRWLEWRGCPQTFKATNMHLEKLVILDISWSKITEDWQGWKAIKMRQLEVLNLTGCTDLLVTPNFSAFPNLEMLILEHCHKLGKIDPSIMSLEHLVSLNLKFCRSLHELPEGLGNLEALKELLIDETPLKEIPGLVGENELEDFRASSTQHSEWICPPEVNLVHESKQLKIFYRGNICIERNSKAAYLELTGKLVGIDYHVQEIMRKLDIINHDRRLVKQFSTDVRAVQIFGMGGAGKTTIAKVVYDKIRPLFPYCAFLEDIGDNAKRKRILSLQRQLLSDLQKKECPELNSSEEATLIIKNMFRSQQVLIVFDNVNSIEQIHPFMQKLSWFGPGSKIIITTRRRRSFIATDGNGVIAKYKVKQMSHDEAFQLFNKHAFRGCPPEEDYYSLSRKIISIIGRLPLSIEVVASHLYSKRAEKGAWKDALKKLQNLPHNKFQKVFTLTYNNLGDKARTIFLDIACFFIGKDKRFASYMVEALGSSPEGIDSMHDLSLVETGGNNDLWMHQKVRDFGRKIAREENSKGSARLWNHKHALSTLRKRKGGGKVVGLALKNCEQSIDLGFSCSRLLSRASKLITKGRGPTKYFTREDFFDLQNLNFLKLGYANIRGNFECVLSNLRWLDWQGCPEILEATNFNLPSLIILDLSWSKVSQDWNGWTQLEMINLKVLNLTGCPNLLSSPDLSRCQCLEMLILEGCFRLVELHPSLVGLKHLVSLNLKSCSGLNMLPERLDKLVNLEELMIDGTSIKEIPSSIGNMKQLKTFSASGCTLLSQLPVSVGELVMLQRLSLRDCHRLAKLPDYMDKLGMSLNELDVSGTGISRLSDSIINLQNLRVLRMDSCFITEFPHNIGKLSKLEEIHASWCRSMEGSIPSDIGKLKQLRVLRLQHSKICSLPAEIQNLSRLRTLDLLHCDMLEEFPRLPSNLTDLHVDPGLSKIIGYSQNTNSVPYGVVQSPQLPGIKASRGWKIMKLKSAFRKFTLSSYISRFKFISIKKLVWALFNKQS